LAAPLKPLHGTLVCRGTPVGNHCSIPCASKISVNTLQQNLHEQLLRRYSSAKKLQSQTIIREKLHKALSYEKRAHKMLMKLTPGVNFINILRTPFAPIFLRQKITKPKCN